MIVFFNDIFYNTFPNNAPNFYDNDWAFLGINQALSEHLNLEIGYLRATKERSTQTEFDLENAISFSVLVKL